MSDLLGNDTERNVSSYKIGLVTVLFNGKEVLPDFFKSLSIQTHKNFILYIIDNSPNDEARTIAKDLIAKYDISTEFIINKDNLGVAKGNNQGIELGLSNNCDYILLLNNDIEFSENTIQDMLKASVLNQLSIVVPKIYYAGTNKIWMAGGHISKLKGTTVHRGDGEEDKGQYNQIEYTNYAPTCFMLLYREVFEKVGFMDELYFVYYDDTDFIYRANELGIKITYFPVSKVQHKVSFSTGGEENVFTIYYMHRNRIIFIFKRLNVYYRVVALSYLFLTRLIKLPFYKKGELSIIYRAIRDGLTALE